jgi:hypothetical protein
MIVKNLSMVVSVWSKDYDSVGGKKRFCLYMYNTQARVKKEEGDAFCM